MSTQSKKRTNIASSTNLMYSGWNLAFINACVPLLHIFDDQGPFICGRIVSGQESLIRGVCILAYSQNVNISMANPCDL